MVEWTNVSAGESAPDWLRLTQMHGTHADYMARQASLDKAIKAGYILPADHAGLI